MEAINLTKDSNDLKEIVVAILLVYIVSLVSYLIIHNIEYTKVDGATNSGVIADIWQSWDSCWSTGWNLK